VSYFDTDVLHEQIAKLHKQNAKKDKQIAKLQRECNEKLVFYGNKNYRQVVKELAERDIEQQVKGLSEFAESLLFRGCLENTFEIHDVLDRIIQLKGNT
jgi:hypothetical protein